MKFANVLLIITLMFVAGCSTKTEKITRSDIDQWVLQQDGTIVDRNGKKINGFNLFEPASENDGPFFSDIKKLYSSYQAVYGDRQVPPAQPIHNAPANTNASGLTLDEFKKYSINIESGEIVNRDGLAIINFRMLDKDGQPSVDGFFAQLSLLYFAKEQARQQVDQSQQNENKQAVPIVHTIGESIQLSDGLLLTISDLQFDANENAIIKLNVENPTNESREFTAHFGYQSSTQEYLSQFQLETTDLGNILPGKSVEVSYKSKNSIKNKDIQALTLDTRSIKAILNNPTLAYEYLITMK